LFFDLKAGVSHPSESHPQEIYSQEIYSQEIYSQEIYSQEIYSQEIYSQESHSEASSPRNSVCISGRFLSAGFRQRSTRSRANAEWLCIDSKFSQTTSKEPIRGSSRKLIATSRIMSSTNLGLS